MFTSQKIQQTYHDILKTYNLKPEQLVLTGQSAALFILGLSDGQAIDHIEVLIAQSSLGKFVEDHDATDIQPQDVYYILDQDVLLMGVFEDTQLVMIDGVGVAAPRQLSENLLDEVSEGPESPALLELLKEAIRLRLGSITVAVAEQAEDAAEELQNKIDAAKELIIAHCGADTGPHKSWVLDQVFRILAGDSYEEEVAEACDEDDDPEAHVWDVGIAP